MDYFSRLVSEEVVCRAGFNYHQPSMGLQNHNGQNYIVYLGQFGSDQLNIVVIEGTRPHKDGYKRKEFFLELFGVIVQVNTKIQKNMKPLLRRLRKL